MRLLYLVLLGLLAFGCVQDGGVTNGDQNLTEAQLRPFLDAGCTNTSDGRLDCQNASFPSQFNCSPWLVRMVRADTGNGSLPLLECWVEVDRSAARDEYFFCSGGMLNICISYVLWDDGRFVQIKTPGELAAKIAPIESEKEALGYVLLAKDVTSRVERPILGDLRAKAERNAGGFLVTAYYYSPFGCYSKIDYEEVRYQVSSDGTIEEISRNVAYTKYLDYAICVD